MPEDKIVMYGADWCSDTRRAKRFFEQRDIPYKWVDIQSNREGQNFVKEVNGGKSIIPTIVFTDGSILVEPSNAELTEKVDSQDP
ncbi:MAG: glutaredoxin domain-containing protein [Chloroflexota bacterium]